MEPAVPTVVKQQLRLPDQLRNPPPQGQPSLRQPIHPPQHLRPMDEKTPFKPRRWPLMIFVVLVTALFLAACITTFFSVGLPLLTEDTTG